MPRTTYPLSETTLKGQIPVTLNQVIFVDSNNGDARGSGRSDRAYSSLANVIANQGGLSAGDVIMLAPGHTETISSATALTLSVAGLRIVGMGYGTLRPQITLDTANTATINITADNIRFENCVFIANFLNIAALFTLTTAKSFQCIDCVFRDTTASLNFKAIISTNTTSNAADGIHMERCKWLGLGSTTGTTVVKMNGTNDRFYMEDCYFAHKNADDGGLFMLIATGKVLTNMEIKSCRFNLVGVSSATAGVLVTTDGTTNSGYFYNCFVKHLDATTEIMVTASSGFVFWNLFATAVADKQGYLVPAADA